MNKVQEVFVVIAGTIYASCAVLYPVVCVMACLKYLFN